MMPDARTIAAALVQLEEFRETLRAASLVYEALEACGDVAGVVAQLEQERERLAQQVASLRAVRSEYTTGAERADPRRES